MKKLLVFDGNSLLNRAYYAIRPLTTKSGIYTHAVLGFINILTRHLQNERPDCGAVAFDMRAPTFRHELYEGYKATRKGMPEELAMQLPYAKRAVEYLGLRVVELSGYEADDILGTFARQASQAGCKGYVVTGDRDSFQLVDEHVTVILAANNEDIRYDPAAIKEKYGVPPSALVDVKALMGDSSDEIPGVPGIGEKTALSLISACGTLDNVYKALDGGTLAASPSVKKKLTEGRDSAYMSRTLAEINTAVPLSLTLEELALKGLDKPAMLSLCTELELGSVIKRLELDKSDFEQLSLSDTAGQPVPDKHVSVADGISYTVWSSDILRFLRDGTQEDITLDDSTALSRVFARARIVTDNAKALYSALKERDIPFGEIIFDTSLAGYVLSPTDSSYPLKSLALSYLSENLAEGGECEVMPRLYHALSLYLEERGQTELYKKVELPLAFVLGDTERLGFLVDKEGLHAYGEELEKKLAMLQSTIYEISGHPFNINSPKQLGEVLFDELGLPSQKKTKSGYSTDAEVLDKLAPFNPIIGKILEYRALSKLKGTYCDGLAKVISPRDGRIHTSFNQTVTATGRLSSTEPNLQNIPVRTQAGAELRKFFIAREGCVLVDADYSQIELRLLAHIADDEALIEAFRSGQDIHTATASQVFGVPLEQVTPQMRKSAKAVNFGIVYGIGDYSLSQDIGVSVKEAGEYIKGYFAKYRGVERYMKSIVESARRDGYVSTIMGRRRYIPELSSSKKMIASFGERVAMNTPIQGSAADIIKLAMINCAKRLEKEGLKSRLVLQVHDELIIEAPMDEVQIASELLRYEMENTVSLKVKLAADVSTGKTWYEAH
ncbi:MAG: DNA polymerase I [Eubacteriales bacterium]